jgi:hypothetical protein
MTRAAWPILLTLLLVAATIPHAIEDFRFGEFARFGVSTSAATWALVIVYAVQLAGMILAARASTAGYLLLAAAGLVWCVGAIAIHGPEVVASGSYRNGLESKALIGAIIALGAAAAVVSSVRARR